MRQVAPRPMHNWLTPVCAQQVIKAARIFHSQLSRPASILMPHQNMSIPLTDTFLYSRAKGTEAAPFRWRQKARKPPIVRR